MLVSPRQVRRYARVERPVAAVRDDVNGRLLHDVEEYHSRIVFALNSRAELAPPVIARREAPWQSSARASAPIKKRGSRGKRQLAFLSACWRAAGLLCCALNDAVGARTEACNACHAA
jgi:hypothetical protein